MLRPPFRRRLLFLVDYQQPPSTVTLLHHYNVITIFIFTSGYYVMDLGKLAFTVKGKLISGLKRELLKFVHTKYMYSVSKCYVKIYGLYCQVLIRGVVCRMDMYASPLSDALPARMAKVINGSMFTR